MKEQAYASVEGTAALKWDGSPEREGAGDEARIIAFPGRRSEGDPADRFQGNPLQTAGSSAPRLSFLVRLRRVFTNPLRYERLKGIEFDQVSRRGEIGVSAAFAAIGLLIVLIGS